MYQPKTKGKGKLGNIVDLLNYQTDISATHELFRRFDNRCQEALKNNPYTLILDEALTAVEPYHFAGKEDFEYLVQNKDVEVDEQGTIHWIGSTLDTRFDDVKILAKNNCLFRVDDKFFLWHFPHEIFSLFEDVYILTYMFEGSLMKYYFDIYGIKYIKKSVALIDGEYKLIDYTPPDKSNIRKRIKVYDGKMNTDISEKNTAFSATWCKASYNQSKIQQLKNNFYNFSHNVVKASSNNVMWTSYKNIKKDLKQKGYTKGFVPCNCRGTNNYRDKTCLMYGCNWFENPEIVKFFASRNTSIDQDKIALSTLLQWIWRSNIRVPDSNKPIDIYIPSTRMRQLFSDWLSV
jgi:hypothetical protein